MIDYFAPEGLNKPENQPDQRGFSASVGSDHTNVILLLNRKVNIMQHNIVVVSCTGIANLNNH